MRNALRNGFLKIPSVGKSAVEKTCYLCGKLINKELKGRDHIPPKTIFPEHIRKKLNLSKLRWRWTHKNCNESYGYDEEYFKLSIGASAIDSPILKYVWDDLKKMARKPQTQNLRLKVYSEFISEVRTPNHIILPGVIAKTFETKRIYRVVWKIIRGLYFIEFSNILPETTPHYISYIQKDAPMFSTELLTILFHATLAQKEKGDYADIFSYWYYQTDKKDFYSWIINFWSRHPFFIFHHLPSCTCEKCSKGCS